MKLFTGERDGYFWLSTDLLFDSVFEVCPEAMPGRYLVATSLGHLPAAEIPEGWTIDRNILYSPQVSSSASPLPHHDCESCQMVAEWYVFDRPTNLGTIREENIFEALIAPGGVYSIVSFVGFGLHSVDHEPICEIFWRQMAWIQPEAYIAKNNVWLNFVSRDCKLFADAEERIRKS